MNGPSEMRISDGDRHQVAEVLQRAAGEGRLDLDELGERLEATYAAKVYADLLPIVADLPGVGPETLPGLPNQAHPGQPYPAPYPATHPGPGYPIPAQPGSPPGMPLRYDSSTAILSGQDRKGLWTIGPTHNAFALMGGVTLDLRQAYFTTREVLITANAIMGAVDVYVNAGTHVVVDGVGILGAFEEGSAKVTPEFGPHAPVVRVKGFALMGAVTVTRKKMPGEPRRFLRRH